jgi:ABC-type multidrug transport system fused ATPase/permease subunit
VGEGESSNPLKTTKRIATPTATRTAIQPNPQEPKLLSLDISSNILYGCPWPATQADVEAAAREANAHEFIAELPEGYGTKVTDK